MRADRDWIQDMLDAIEHVNRYAVRGLEAIEKDELIRVWMIHHLQVLGEAAARLGKSFHHEHPEIPWAEIVAFRNLLVHEYFGIDLDEIWATIERDLPSLKIALTSLQNKLSPSEQ